MALKNVLGGLTLDETLKQLIEKMRDWKDPEWVTSHPDMPVHVAGKVTPQQDPAIGARVQNIVASTTAGIIVPTNLGRSALSIVHSSTSGIMYVLASSLAGPGGQTVSTTLFTVQLAVNDYWELPQGVGGPYKGPIAAIWTVSPGSAMVTEYS